ncbi:MAG: hypothetical protein L6U99_12870 [Clostridium sp.]|nr:MAG: hypothetical protein L6U99_12870 [Clostridium sp.]
MVFSTKWNISNLLFFFGDYHNELTFLNSPIDSLAYIKGNNEYLDLYKKK